MSEVHLQPVPGTSVVAHNPGVSPVNKGAGQPLTVVKDASGKIVSTSGQVPGTGVVHNNPG